jgi:hypothetical protein
MTMKPNPFGEEAALKAQLAHMRTEVAKLPTADPLPRSSKARLGCNVSGVAVFWGSMPRPEPA